MQVKPCPFCGSVSMRIHADRYDDVAYVECIKCDARGPAAVKPSVGGGAYEALEAWNQCTCDGSKMGVIHG